MSKAAGTIVPRDDTRAFKSNRAPLFEFYNIHIYVPPGINFVLILTTAVTYKKTRH